MQAEVPNFKDFHKKRLSSWVFCVRRVNIFKQYKIVYRSGIVNSKSFIGKDFL